MPFSTESLENVLRASGDSCDGVGETKRRKLRQGRKRREEEEKTRRKEKKKAKSEVALFGKEKEFS